MVTETPHYSVPEYRCPSCEGVEWGVSLDGGLWEAVLGRYRQSPFAELKCLAEGCNFKVKLVLNDDKYSPDKGDIRNSYEENKRQW